MGVKIKARTIFAPAVLAIPLMGASLPGVDIGSFATAQTAPSSARAGIRACAQMKGMRSEHSREPTAITFVNGASTYRALNWIDFKGAQKSYGGLNPGERKTIKTFRTHPWVIATGPGDCIQIVLPAAEPSTVVLK